MSFSDANLIGNQKFAEQLLEALADFGRKNNYPIQFSAEMTITVAERPRLLELLREANFTSIFVGIESPRVDSLMETKKRQNAHRPLLDSVRLIQSHNLLIVAGMIVGFDHDDQRIFEEQFDFLMEAGIPFTTCGVLTAIEKTPLHARLQKEGRLLPYDSATVMGHGAADLNFIPKLMTVEEVQRGYNWLIRSLYRYDNYGARVIQAFRPFQKRWEQKATGQFDWDLTVDRAQGLPALPADDQRPAPPGLPPDPPGGHEERVVSREARRRHLLHDRPQALPRVRDRGPRRSGDGAGAVPVRGRVARAVVGGRVRPGLPGEPPARGGRGPAVAPPWLAWFRPGLRRAVAVPEAFLTEKVGECLRRYLDELGVEVIPVATAALSRLRGRADLFVLPIFGSVRKGQGGAAAGRPAAPGARPDGSGQAAPRRPPLDRRRARGGVRGLRPDRADVHAASGAAAGGLRDGGGRRARAVAAAGPESSEPSPPDRSRKPNRLGLTRCQRRAGVPGRAPG